MLENTCFRMVLCASTVMGESLNESWDKEVGGGVTQSAREAQGGNMQQLSIKFWPLGPSWGHFGAHFGVVWRLLEAFETQMARERRLEEVLGHSGGPLGAVRAPSWAASGRLRGPSWAVLGASWAVLGPSWAVLGPSWAVLGLPWGS